MNVSMLENVPLFSGLTEAQRALIGERMVLETRRAGELLYSAGEPATKTYLIKSGWVRLISEQRTILANVSQGSLLGDGELLLDQSYSTSAKVATPLEVWVLSADDLADVVSQDLQIGLELSKAVGATAAPLLRYLINHRLRSLPGFEGLPEDTLMAIAGRLCVHVADAGETLFAAGHAPVSLYLLEQGRVALTEKNKSVLEFEAGDLVGEQNVFAGRADSMTAKSLEACWLWELSVDDMEKLCEIYPDLRTLLASALRAALSTADQSRAAALLKSTPVFEALPAVALNELARRLNWEVVPPGKRIFEANSPANAMYLVESGQVELLNQRGQPMIHIPAGGYFGEEGLMEGGQYSTAAQARVPTNLWVLTFEDVEKASQRFPIIRTALLAELALEKGPDEEHFAERYLRHMPLFEKLTNEQVRDVAEHLREAKYKPGEAVYRRGALPTALYLIEQGQVTVQSRAPEGGVHVLASLGPGDFFGETALLTNEPHSADAFAVGATSIWALTSEDFETLIVRYPSIALSLSRVLSRRLRDSDEQATAVTSRVVAAPIAVVAAGEAGAATPAAVPTGALVGLNKAANEASTWFTARSTGAKLRFAAVLLLALWLLVAVVYALLSSGSRQTARSVQSSLLNSSALVAYRGRLADGGRADLHPVANRDRDPNADLHADQHADQYATADRDSAADGDPGSSDADAHPADAAPGGAGGCACPCRRGGRTCAGSAVQAVLRWSSGATCRRARTISITICSSRWLTPVATR